MEETIKCVLVGDGGVGKIRLLKSYTNKFYSDKRSQHVHTRSQIETMTDIGL